MIVARVNNNSNLSEWIMIGVYGDPAKSDNLRIWEEIESVLEEDGVLVVVIGDFNAITSNQEKWGWYGSHDYRCSVRTQYSTGTYVTK